MPLLGYDANFRFALADEPVFPDEATAAAEFPALPPQIVLQEWGTYFLRCYGETPPFFNHLPKSTLASSRAWSGAIREINFQNYVGLSRLGSLRLRVENRKIGDELFHALLDEVAARYADLIFGYSQDPVGQGYCRSGSPGRNLLYVEYLFLRRFLLTEDMDKIATTILRNPHYRLARESGLIPIEAARVMEPAALLDSLSHANRLCRIEPSHPLATTDLAQRILQRSGRHLFPTVVPEERRFHSYDTHENRFIKHVLEAIQQRLDTLSQQLDPNREGLLNPNIGKDLDVLRGKVDACLDDPLWREVGRLRLVPEHSPVLQRREGYRQLFRLHALLQLLTRYDYPLMDFAHLLETKDTATLYEYWCFFQIKAVLDSRDAPLRMNPLTDDSPTRQTLRQGVSLTYPDGLKLSFNWTAQGSRGLERDEALPPGYAWRESSSRELRPDFVLEGYGRRLILDAKNKGQREGFYGGESDGTISTSKDEDIVKMHAYRDAIADVWGAYALFPGHESRVYPAHNAPSRWSGVGSLALRPEATGQAEPRQIRDLETLIRAFCEQTPVGWAERREAQHPRR